MSESKQLFIFLFESESFETTNESFRRALDLWVLTFGQKWIHFYLEFISLFSDDQSVRQSLVCLGYDHNIHWEIDIYFEGKPKTIQNFLFTQNS